MDDVATGDSIIRTRLTREELAESLLFYRRRLAEKLAVALIQNGWGASGRDVPGVAEDLANAICERLAARETGDARGYRSE